MTDDPGHTSVLVSDRQETPVDLEALTQLAREVLGGEDASGSELSLSFVTVDEMSELHETYMGETGPTDVLSFSLDEDEDGTRVLGDVVICPEYAAGNNPDLPSELRLLVVHGILHLLGHDHEDPGDKAAMWERQSRYVEVVVP